MQSGRPESYILLCRGGGGMTLSLNIDQGGIAIVDADFRQSAQPAGTNGERLADGTCSWIDRGMRPGEPSHVRVDDGKYYMEMRQPKTTRLVVSRAVDQAYFDVSAVQTINSDVAALNWPAGAPLSPPLSGRAPVATDSPSLEFRRGPANGLQIRSNGGTWIDGGGVLTSDPAAAPLPSGQTFVAARGQDLGIWVTTCERSACTGWTSIGGVLTSAPSVSVSVDGSVQVTALGQDAKPWRNVFDAGKKTWSGWQAVR